jgi:TatD DNase family protein
LAIAAEAARPVIIHAREADDDVAAILRSDARTSVVLHSFSSGPVLLRAGLDLGHYLSFSGMVTFRNWALDDAVRAVPLERLLVETDGPYLAPVPCRGKRNEPAFLRHTAERIAAVRGMDAPELIEATTRNAERLFGLQSSVDGHQ